MKVELDTQPSYQSNVTYLNKDIFGQTRPQKTTSDFLKKLLKDILQKEKDVDPT